MAAPKITFAAAADLADSPNNARTHSPEQVATIAGLLTRFGFTSPILVDADGIVAGHGRKLGALKVYAEGGSLRFPDGTAIPAGKVPTLDVSGWSAEDRRAYMLADNQVALTAGWDTEMLRAEIAALEELGDDLGDLGFDAAELERLIGDAATETETTTRRAPGGTQDDTTFVHTEQYGVIVSCKDEAEQERVFNRLRDEGLSVKVVVV